MKLRRLPVWRMIEDFVDEETSDLFRREHNGRWLIRAENYRGVRFWKKVNPAKSKYLETEYHRRKENG